jgi:hypothetical protein
VADECAASCNCVHCLTVDVRSQKDTKSLGASTPWVSIRYDYVLSLTVSRNMVVRALRLPHTFLPDFLDGKVNGKISAKE